jgi:hypothetical protein
MHFYLHYTTSRIIRADRKSSHTHRIFYVRKVKKVKVTLVQALRLCTGRTAHRGSRGIAVLYRH